VSTSTSAQLDGRLSKADSPQYNHKMAWRQKDTPAARGKPIRCLVWAASPHDAAVASQAHGRSIPLTFNSVSQLVHQSDSAPVEHWLAKGQSEGRIGSIAGKCATAQEGCCAAGVLHPVQPHCGEDSCCGPKPSVSRRCHHRLTTAVNRHSSATNCHRLGQGVLSHEQLGEAGNTRMGSFLKEYKMQPPFWEDVRANWRGMQPSSWHWAASWVPRGSSTAEGKGIVVGFKRHGMCSGLSEHGVNRGTAKTCSSLNARAIPGHQA
jgi:hypothetical protein